MTSVWLAIASESVGGGLGMSICCRPDHYPIPRPDVVELYQHRLREGSFHLREDNNIFACHHPFLSELSCFEYPIRRQKSVSAIQFVNFVVRVWLAYSIQHPPFWYMVKTMSHFCQKGNMAFGSNGRLPRGQCFFASASAPVWTKETSSMGKKKHGCWTDKGICREGEAGERAV